MLDWVANIFLSAGCWLCKTFMLWTWAKLLVTCPAAAQYMYMCQMIGIWQTIQVSFRDFITDWFFECNCYSNYYHDYHIHENKIVFFELQVLKFFENILFP